MLEPRGIGIGKGLLEKYALREKTAVGGSKESGRETEDRSERVQARPLLNVFLLLCLTSLIMKVMEIV